LRPSQRGRIPRPSGGRTLSRAGLRTLHDLLGALPEWDRTAVGFEDREAFVSLIDGADQPSLVSSAPAVDVASAAASRHGVGVTRATTIRDDPTVPMLGHAAYATADRGFPTVVLATDGADRHRILVATTDDPYPRIAERELDAPSTAHTTLSSAIRTGAYTRRDNPLTQAFFTGRADTEYSTADGRAVNRLLRRSVEPDTTGDPEPEFVLVPVDPDYPRHAGGLARVFDEFVSEQAAEFTRTFDPIGIDDRAETLLHEGVEIKEDVWRDIFDWSGEVLAPEFEGSYRGVGFNINE
jgi:hypothetical protein